MYYECIMNTADDEACNIAEKQDAQWLLWTCPDWLRTKIITEFNFIVDM